MTFSYTLLMLAGGQGQRMGGRDKGLVEVDGVPLADRLVAALSRETAPARIVISANRNLDAYAARADRVVADRRPDFPGPLAGLEAGLCACEGAVLCLPCDLLDPPAELVSALLRDLRADTVQVARDEARLQPLCLALHAEPWHASISAHLDSGGHSARGWLATVPHREIPIPGHLQNLNAL